MRRLLGITCSIDEHHAEKLSAVRSEMERLARKRSS
jgi:hypothetical protein